MTVPKWLIPLLAVVAALAVGVAGWLVGIRVAPGEAPVAAPQIETLPVAGPVDPDAPQTDDGIVVSPAIGSADVVVPPATEDVPQIDPMLAEIIREMADSDDPGAGMVEVYDASSEPGASGADGSGDICAPPEGEAPEDCPSGVYGTVLALTAPEEPFYADAQYAPGRYSEVPPPHRVHCEPVATDATQAHIGIGTNAPAQLTVRYYPEGDRTAERAVTAETPEAVAAAWYGGLDANDEFSGIWARPQHCLVLDGLEPGVAYRLEVSAVDELGRTATDTLRFVAGGGSDVPPVRVIPIIDTVLFVSAPHTDEETVEIRVASTVGEDGASACRSSSRLLDPYVDVDEYRVSNGYNAAHGFDPAYVARTAGSFVVPEGSRVAVCIRWFAEDAPSWEGDGPLREYTQMLLSPDLLLPRIELAGVGLLKVMDTESVSIRIDDREGRRCGSSAVGPADGPTRDWDVAGTPLRCEPSSAWAWRDGGDYVARAEVSYRGETTTGGMIMRLSRDACRGVCEIPEPTEYRMALPTIAAPAGLCGSSFGDCDPPTSDTSAGVAVFRVSWVQGNTNGAAEWVEGAPTLSERASPLPPERPQVDTAHAIEVVETGGGLIASLRLRTDRPVSYTAYLDGCELDGTRTTLSGAIDDPLEVTLDFGPVCHAESYRATVELVDDAGVTATWGPREPDGFWPNSVRTPGIPIELGGSLHVEPELGDAAQGYLESVIVYVAGVSAFEWTEGRCFGPGGTDLGFTSSVEASESTAVGVTLVWGPAPATGPCESAETHAERPSTRIPIDDLSSGRTIRIPLDEVVGGSSVLQLSVLGR